MEQARLEAFHNKHCQMFRGTQRIHTLPGQQGINTLFSLQRSPKTEKQKEYEKDIVRHV